MNMCNGVVDAGDDGRVLDAGLVVDVLVAGDQVPLVVAGRGQRGKLPHHFVVLQTIFMLKKCTIKTFLNHFSSEKKSFLVDAVDTFCENPLLPNIPV